MPYIWRFCDFKLVQVLLFDIQCPRLIYWLKGKCWVKQKMDAGSMERSIGDVNTEYTCYQSFSTSFFVRAWGLRGRVVNASRFEPTRPSPLGFESHER